MDNDLYLRRLTKSYYAVGVITDFLKDMDPLLFQMTIAMVVDSYAALHNIDNHELLHMIFEAQPEVDKVEGRLSKEAVLENIECVKEFAKNLMNGGSQNEFERKGSIF